MNFTFNFAEMKKLDSDLAGASKIVPQVAVKVLRETFTIIRNELRPLIPKQKGALQRSFGFSIRKTQQNVVGRVGFIVGKRVTANTAIAANVLQKPGARPKKGKYLWIPLPGTNQTPKDY